MSLEVSKPLHTRGLTLGKFAPLHKGHQYVIETALREMDELIVLIYDAPEVTPIPLRVRSEWLRSLYPATEVIEVWNGPREVGYTRALKAMHEKCILGVLDGTRISHFYSSERYGQHVSRALNAENRNIDSLRRKHPISGSAIRAEPYEHRHFLHPRVYSDLITNVVFLGGPSTGKTTIARALASHLGTHWMPEYGREFWHKNQKDRRLSPTQLVELADGHIEREMALFVQCDRYLFTDTNAITTSVFSDYYHGIVAPELRHLCVQAGLRYDLVFVCGADIPYDDTSDRSGAANREMLQTKTLELLASLNIPYHLLTGNLKERIRVVDTILKSHKKWSF